MALAPRGVTGVLLAAGAGRRAGGPKALRTEPDGTSWLQRGVAALLGGGCELVVVVLGSRAAAAGALLPTLPAERLVVATANDWAVGMSRSLLAGLGAVPASTPAAVVHLVDLPDVPAEVVRRLLAAGGTSGGALARAGYGGRPGHPVLLGSAHLSALAESLRRLGPAEVDQGARVYLSGHAATLVECGDLASGRDRDSSV